MIQQEQKDLSNAKSSSRIRLSCACRGSHKPPTPPEQLRGHLQEEGGGSSTFHRQPQLRSQSLALPQSLLVALFLQTG